MRKRSKYKPRKLRVDTLSYVVSGFEPMHTDNQVRLSATMHQSMKQLVAGNGTEDDVHFLVYAACMGLALVKLRDGLGLEFKDDIDAGFKALRQLHDRGHANGGRFIFTGEEMKAVNWMIEVHDVQLQAASQLEMERAIPLCNTIVREKMGQS